MVDECFRSDNLSFLDFTIQYDISLKRVQIGTFAFDVLGYLLRKRWECISCTLLIYAPNKEHFFNLSLVFSVFTKKKKKKKKKNMLFLNQNISKTFIFKGNVFEF